VLAIGCSPGSLWRSVPRKDLNFHFPTDLNGVVRRDQEQIHGPDRIAQHEANSMTRAYERMLWERVITTASLAPKKIACSKSTGQPLSRA